MWTWSWPASPSTRWHDTDTATWLNISSPSLWVLSLSLSLRHEPRESKKSWMKRKMHNEYLIIMTWCCCPIYVYNVCVQHCQVRPSLVVLSKFNLANDNVELHAIDGSWVQDQGSRFKTLQFQISTRFCLKSSNMYTSPFHASNPTMLQYSFKNIVYPR